MKFAAPIFLLLVFVGLSLGLKDPTCDQLPAANGIGGRICLAYSPSWSFYPKENACKKFIYGGCGGNDNRFSNQKQCETACKE